MKTVEDERGAVVADERAVVKVRKTNERDVVDAAVVALHRRFLLLRLEQVEVRAPAPNRKLVALLVL